MRANAPPGDLASAPDPAAATDHVLIFTKYPTPGYAKTRLISAVGATRAAQISRHLTEHTVGTVRAFLLTNPTIHSLIHFASPPTVPDAQPLMRTWLGLPPPSAAARESLHAQSDGDLGARLTSAFAASFAAGAHKAVVIGSDSPEVDEAVLSAAFAALDEADLVIGPAEDGGYYLLGLTSPHPELFRGVPWSTDTVCAITLRLADMLRLTVAKLTTLRDIDLPEDLPYFQTVVPTLRSSTGAAP